MKFLALGVVSFASVLCYSQTFSTTLIQTTIPGATANFVAVGNTYTANLTGFQISSSQLTGDLAWVFNFNSQTAGPYSSVTIEIGGQTINGAVDFVGNEKVFDMTGSPLEVANGLVDGSGSGGGTFDPWVYTATYNFSQPVSIGQAQKNILFYDSYFGTGITQVDYIKQTFHPVPEPATLAAIGFGVAAMARRRRVRTGSRNRS
jgi:hypothetical protein